MVGATHKTTDIGAAVIEMRPQLEEMFARVRADIEPALLEMAKAHPDADPQEVAEMIKINSAVNFLRMCSEVALRASLPFGHEVPGEVAVRVAAHLISCVPPGGLQHAMITVALGLGEHVQMLHDVGGAMDSQWGTMQ